MNLFEMKTSRILLILLLIISSVGFNKAFAVHEDFPGSEKAELKDDFVENNPASTTSTQDQKEDVVAGFDEFPNLHPLVVHFPVVLLIFAALLQILQVFRLNRTLDWVILLLAGAGFIGAYIAANFVHPHAEGLNGVAKEVLEHHETYAMWVIWSSAGGAVLKLVSLFDMKQKRIFEVVVSLVILFSAYSVSKAGHYGSQLVYIEGVGPQGNFLGEEGHEEHEHEH